MQAAAQSPTLIWAALDHLTLFAASPKASGHLRINSLIDQSFRATQEHSDDSDRMAADFTAWLEASPMLNDVEHFRSYPSADTTHRRNRSALDTFRNRGRKVSDDVQRFRDEVLAWLDARPRTAGVILVDAAMRNEPLADTLTKLLPHQDLSLIHI